MSRDGIEGPIAASIIVVKTARSDAIPMIAVTARLAEMCAPGSIIAITITGTIAATGIIEITGISTGIIVDTIMAITIAISIVVTISGTIRRAPITMAATVRTITIRVRRLTSSMIATTPRGTALVGIMAITIIRSLSATMIIGASTIHRTVITGSTTMIAAMRSSPRLPLARSLVL